MAKSKFRNLLILVLFVGSKTVYSAPTVKEEITGNRKNTTINDVNDESSSEYNFEQFAEVYDQRQNGTDNYKVNVDGVVLVWAPLGPLLTATTLLDPNLFGESEYPDIQEVLNPQNSEKPIDAFTALFSRTNSLGNPSVNLADTENGLTQEKPHKKLKAGQKRFRTVPRFLRPFIRNRRVLVKKLE